MSSRWGYLWSIAVLLILWQVGAWWAGEDVLVGPIIVLRKLASEAGTVLFLEACRHVIISYSCRFGHRLRYGDASGTCSGFQSQG